MAEEIKFDHYLNCCVGKPGYVYNFNTQSLVNFEENLKFKGDIPLTAYIDFETTAPIDECLDPESKKMFVVPYVIVFAFYPELDINRAITERSFGHSKHSLTSLTYLTIDQLQSKDNKTLLQLRDCALNVAEMFSTEIKFAGDCLIKWFNKKFESKNLELSNDVKRKYEIENPIDWIEGRCCICKFPLRINPTNFNATTKQMFYADFVTFKEHKFLKNIFSERELPSTDSLKNMKQYHKYFEKCLVISVYLQKLLEKLAIEKNRVEVLTKQFLMQHRYFSKTWLILTEKQKTQVLKITVSGKGVIPCEKIDAIDALQKEPEDGIFFSKEEFFSTLKGQAVNDDDDDYENSKKLFYFIKNAKFP